MKKFALLIGTAALVFASCTKEMPGTDPNAPQDVIFTSPLTDGGLKGLKTGPPALCSNPDADYALVAIGDKTFYPAVFTVNNVLYTQAIKLAPGTHVLSTFALIHDVNHDTQFNVDGTRSNFSDDVVVRATPQTGSDFAPFVTSPVSINFTVNAFEKVEIPVEVLCFEEAKYTSFGFAWFKPIETTVREMVFFGDFCTKFYLDYSTSDYGKQVGGVKVDMPAIFRIDVHMNGNATPAKTYTNGTAAANWGVGSPVVVKYSDKPGVVDNYEFKLYILVKVGTGFEYKYMNSWLFKDNEQLVTQNGTGPGLDGVYDFVLGNCNALQADFAFAPYMNLPETSDLVVGMPANTGRESYLLMNLTNFKVGGVTRSGFDLETGSLPGFCINKQISIGVGTTYNVNVYGTLLSSTVLPAQLAAIEWDKINWLVNHLDRFAGYKWYDLQNALWKLENPAYAGEGDPGNGVPAVNFNDPLAMASKMFAAATANGDGYVPLPGGWAAVATVNSGTNLIQALFTIVDP